MSPDTLQQFGGYIKQRARRWVASEQRSSEQRSSEKSEETADKKKNCVWLSRHVNRLLHVSNSVSVLQILEQVCFVANVRLFELRQTSVSVAVTRGPNYSVACTACLQVEQ